MEDSMGLAGRRMGGMGRDGMVEYWRIRRDWPEEEWEGWARNRGWEGSSDGRDVRDGKGWEARIKGWEGSSHGRDGRDGRDGRPSDHLRKGWKGWTRGEGSSHGRDGRD
eukprot:143057-Hanusia_phi.AAC.1